MYKLVEWCEENELFLNCNKCKILSKDLGVLFHQKLTFSLLIQSVVNRAM